MGQRIKYKDYLHGSKSSNHSKADELGIPEEGSVRDKFIYALYEVEFDMEVDMETGETWILGVNGVKLEKPVK